MITRDYSFYENKEKNTDPSGRERETSHHDQ